MFERFTDHARQAVSVAADEARELGADHVCAPHILLGLLREDDGIAAQALEETGVRLADTRARLRPGDRRTAGELPFDRGGKRVLERALRESLRLGEHYVGGEHLLLGVLREEDIADVVDDTDAVRVRLLELLPVRPERRRGKRAKLGDDAQATLSRARDLAESEGASEVGVEHLRAALGDAGST
jgi:ATP-dependent Clp protease ATP-binding subunit ClpC